MVESNSNASSKSPLLGYNTNVRHSEEIFHIQTEDSGIGHPHIITHLFTSGTILASKKTSYEEYLKEESWKEIVQQKMKDQHKLMFVELRDGVYDEIASQILGIPIINSKTKTASSKNVKVMQPAAMKQGSAKEPNSSSKNSNKSNNRSIFDAPDTSGSTFGEDLISNKSLDEVILDYLKDELD